VLGRLFTAPTKDNRQVDIVIAVTPKVIRAPSILPEDEVERPTGSLATPTNGSLEAMIIQEDREELLAAARRIPNTTAVQLPDQNADGPTYVRGANETATPDVTAKNVQNAVSPSTLTAESLRPIDTSVKTLQVAQTSDSAVKPETRTLEVAAPAGPSNAASAGGAPTAQIVLANTLSQMKRGERAKLLVNIDSSAAFRSAVLGLKFDENKVAVRSIAFGDVFGTGLANSAAAPFLNQNGKTFVSLSIPQGVVQQTKGTLAVIEIEALADGTPEIAFERDVLNFLTSDGKNFVVKF
jgi:hypothetical protein